MCPWSLDPYHLVLPVGSAPEGLSRPWQLSGRERSGKLRYRSGTKPASPCWFRACSPSSVNRYQTCSAVHKSSHCPQPGSHAHLNPLISISFLYDLQPLTLCDSQLVLTSCLSPTGNESRFAPSPPLLPRLQFPHPFTPDSRTLHVQGRGGVW